MAAKYHRPPFLFSWVWLGMGVSLAGGVNLGTGIDRTNARARAFMMQGLSISASYQGRIVTTEPVLSFFAADVAPEIGASAKARCAT